MGKISFFTKEQKIILDEIIQNDLLKTQFYFTGGTALSSYYLYHRYSEYLDLFSIKRFDNQVLYELMQEWNGKHAFSFESRFSEVVCVFQLHFKNKINLKVDFGYYPYRQLEKGQTFDNIPVDSLTDIAVNKLLTISQRTDVKDFVDLYFLLKEFTVWDLMEGLRIKFRMKKEPILLAYDFLKVEEFSFLPKMIKPLTLEQLKIFFRQKAKETAAKSVE